MDNQNTAVTAAAPFNLADFEARDSAFLEVQNKQDDGPLLFNGQPVRIEVLSPGTKEALRAQHKIETSATARTFAAMRGKPVKETSESKLEERVERLLSVTGVIENFPITARELYANPKLGYITEQVNKFHGDWANF